MRARLVILVVAILAVAGFAALNWSEFLRTTPLSFGLVVMDAPLGLILLGMLAIALLAFIATSAFMQTRGLLEYRQNAKALDTQRELADKAEASRFTELRQYLDAQVRETRQREAIAATEFERAMVQSQRELRTQLEQMDRSLLTRLAELEGRANAGPELQLRTRPETQGST
ncbi:MAG: hypothetical protein ABIT82_07600 [Ramlibacter sp.]